MAVAGAKGRAWSHVPGAVAFSMKAISSAPLTARSRPYKRSIAASRAPRPTADLASRVGIWLLGTGRAQAEPALLKWVPLPPVVSRRARSMSCSFVFWGPTREGTRRPRDLFQEVARANQGFGLQLAWQTPGPPGSSVV